MTTIEFRWATDAPPVHTMPAVEELEYLGYVKVAPHPLYPHSWLMRRDG